MGVVSNLKALESDLQVAGGPGIAKVAAQYVRQSAQAVEGNARQVLSGRGGMSAGTTTAFPDPATAEIGPVRLSALTDALGETTAPVSGARGQGAATAAPVPLPTQAAANLITRGRP